MANGSSGNTAETYFAASSKSRIGERVFEKFRRSITANSQLEQLWSAAYGQYFPAIEDAYGTTARITRDGPKGQLALVKVARNRRLAQAVCGIILGANPDFNPRAVNTSSQARAGVTIAQNILESFWQLRGMQNMVQRWVEQAFAFTESFLYAPWDDTKGEVLGTSSSGFPVRAGDIALRTILPWDTVRESQIKTFEDSTWFGIRVWENKWDLAAQWKRDILGLPTRDKILSVGRDEIALTCSGVVSDFLDDSDLVPVWHFYHLPTPAVPAGREVVLVTPDCVLRDVPYRYGDAFPFVRLTPAELFDTPFGYSAFLDGMGLQELSDGIDSALATNILTCGVQAMVVPAGTKQKADRLLNFEVIEQPMDAKFVAQGVNFTKNPPDAPKIKEGIERDAQQTVGVNDVYLGQPQSAQMNAQAFALLSSMAVQANNPFQRRFLEALGQLGTSIIRTYATRVESSRQLPVIGAGDKHLLSSASFTGEDLKGIEQVYVTAGSALEQTIPGRVQLIELFQSHGVPLQSEQILDVIRTGKMEPLTHALRDELSLMQYENEQLLQGVNPPVHTFHNHKRHCPEHASPLLNPSGMADPRCVTATQQHMDDHYIEYFGLPSPMQPDPATGQMVPVIDPATGKPQKPNPRTDPQFPVRIRMLLGQEPPPMMAPPPGPPGAPPPGGPPGAPPPGPGAPLAPPGSQGVTNGVELPQAPPNPLSGQGVAGGPPGMQ